MLPPLDRERARRARSRASRASARSASLLLLVAERSGGSPLVAEELLAARRELPTASLTGSLDELVVGRLAVRSLECRRVLRLLAPAGRPLDPDAAAGIAADFEIDDVAAGAALDQRRLAAATASSTPDLTAGLTEAIEHGFLVERDGGVGFRHELIGTAVERGPAARSREPATTPRSPRR